MIKRLIEKYNQRKFYKQIANISEYSGNEKELVTLRMEGRLWNIARLCLRRPLQPSSNNHFDEYRFFIDIYELKIQNLNNVYLLCEVKKPGQESLFKMQAAENIDMKIVRSYEDIAKQLSLQQTAETTAFLRELQNEN